MILRIILLGVFFYNSIFSSSFNPGIKYLVDGETIARLKILDDENWNPFKARSDVINEEKRDALDIKKEEAHFRYVMNLAQRKSLYLILCNCTLKEDKRRHKIQKDEQLNRFLNEKIFLIINLEMLRDVVTYDEFYSRNRIKTAFLEEQPLCIKTLFSPDQE